MQTILTHIPSIIRSKKHPRRIWVKSKLLVWNDDKPLGWGRLDKNMRMSNDVFNLLCNTLRPQISKADTRFCKCIPAEIKLAAKL